MSVEVAVLASEVVEDVVVETVMKAFPFVVAVEALLTVAAVAGIAQIVEHQ